MTDRNYLNSLEETETWLEGNMSSEEAATFEKSLHAGSEENKKGLHNDNLRFLHALHHYGERKALTHTLQSVATTYGDKEVANKSAQTESGKIVSFFTKYKKLLGVAACIAGLTALVISVVTLYLSPANNQHQLQQLSREVAQIKKTQVDQSNKILEVASKVPKGAIVKSGGSAFMIDGKGYFITNAHVLNGSGAIVVNTKGQEFKTEIVYIDQSRDLAIIKITDKDFKAIKSLPYGFKRNKLELGQDIFTLGYPRNDIVYNTGYVSAATGFDGDTSSIQVSMMANPGNSGGPLFNKNGEIVGVLSTRETKSEGVSFAIKANEIFQTLDDWKKTDTMAINFKSTNTANMSHLPRTEQVKELESYIYMVKVY